jgi:hypothetical protein
MNAHLRKIHHKPFDAMFPANLHMSAFRVCGNSLLQCDDISLLWSEKELVNLFLEFSGLHHYHLKEGRKLKYSEKAPGDLFIRRLIQSEIFCRDCGSNRCTTGGTLSINSFAAGHLHG